MDGLGKIWVEDGVGISYFKWIPFSEICPQIFPLGSPLFAVVQWGSSTLWFLSFNTFHVLEQIIICCGNVLWTVTCIGVTLASTHEVPDTSPLPVVTTKYVSRQCQMYSGEHNCPTVEWDGPIPTPAPRQCRPLRLCHLSLCHCHNNWFIWESMTLFGEMSHWGDFWRRYWTSKLFVMKCWADSQGFDMENRHFTHF